MATATEQKSTKVKISHVGPIDSIEFDLPESSGGVRVLKGTSGSGKTTALRCLAGLLGSKDDLAAVSPADGADRGEIAGLGRTAKIGARTTVTGETKVKHLGKLDVGALVDPRVADPKARTKARIRALVGLGGSKMNPEDLVGEAWEELSYLIDVDSARECDDPVAMADFIKRQLDSAALDKEKECGVKEGLAAAKRVEAGDVDELEGEISISELAKRHKEAMESLEAMRQSNQMYEDALKANAQIDEQLAKLEVPDVAELEEVGKQLQKVVDGLKARLAAAEANLKAHNVQLDAAKKTVSQQSNLMLMRKPVPVTKYSDADIAAAEKSVESAYSALENSQSLIRRKQALQHAQEYQAVSVEIANEAKQIREAAQAVAKNVQKAIPVGKIVIHEGELMVDYPKRKKLVAYDELSDGERWKIAMEYAINAVGTGGVIPVRQEAWQSLAPELKAEIASQCESAKVWLISAEVAEGPLRVESV